MEPSSFHCAESKSPRRVAIDPDQGVALSAIAMVAAALVQITPVAGALLQEGIDVAVILNALRALGDGRTLYTSNDAGTKH